MRRGRPGAALGAALAGAALACLTGCVNPTTVDTAAVDVTLTDAPAPGAALGGQLLVTAESMVSADGRSWCTRWPTRRSASAA